MRKIFGIVFLLLGLFFLLKGLFYSYEAVFSYAFDYYYKQKIEKVIKITQSFNKVVDVSEDFGDNYFIIYLDTIYKPTNCFRIYKDSIEDFFLLMENQRFDPKNYNIKHLHKDKLDVDIEFSDNYYRYTYSTEKIDLDKEVTGRRNEADYMIAIDEHYYISSFSRGGSPREEYNTIKRFFLSLGIISLLLSYFLLRKYFKKTKRE